MRLQKSDPRKKIQNPEYFKFILIEFFLITYYSNINKKNKTNQTNEKKDIGKRAEIQKDECQKNISTKHKIRIFHFQTSHIHIHKSVIYI